LPYAHIPVGTTHSYPIAIGVDIYKHKIYVANFGDNTVSVINGTSNTKIGKDIPLGHLPVAIDIDPDKNTIYVANSLDNTVSIINGTSNTKIGKDIPVSQFENRGIGIDPYTNTIYVANVGHGVSVIDGKTNKVVAEVMFNTKPSNAGHIECDHVHAMHVLWHLS